MFRVCYTVFLSSSVTRAVFPPNWCNSHGCLGSTWVTSHPKGDDPCFTERRNKVPLRIQQPCSSLTMYFLVACWGHVCWLTLFLRNKNWQMSLERDHDSALTEQHQSAELCLLFQQLTWGCDLFPQAGAKTDTRQRGQNGTGKRCHVPPWKAILNNSSGIRKATF